MRFCGTLILIQNAKIQNDAKILEKSGIVRQIDTLVKGKIRSFEVQILVDSKNHTGPVDINEVEAMIGVVSDIGANLGELVCPAGFTDGAKKRAESAGVQLYEIFHQNLGNSHLFTFGV